jgi:tripartite-type tricarboxylate transporter receptor subunit TctC
MSLVKTVTLIALLAAGTAHAADGDKYPVRPVRVVTGSPGSTSDQIARFTAQKLTERFGQQFIIDNRAGAGGTIGTDIVAKSVPDGHTLTIAHAGTHVSAVTLFPKLPYDPLRDFAPISVLVSTPNVMVVPANSRFKTAAELIDFMKKNPGRLSYASSGAGSSDHLTAELLKKNVGGFAVHIPYRGGAPAMQDIIAGQADFMFSNLGPAAPFIKGGRMRALMLTAAKPAALLPEVPTAASVGVPLEVTSWQAIAAPAGTPPAIIQRLHQAAVKGMNAPDVRERMANQGFDIVANTPEQFGEFMRREVARWKAAVKESGASLD